MFKRDFICLCVGLCWVPAAAPRLPSTRGARPVPAVRLWLGLWVRRLQWLQCPGFASPWQVASSSTRDRAHVPCIGSWILSRRAMREVPGWELVDSDLWKYITSFLCPDVTFLFFSPPPFPPLEKTHFFNRFFVTPFSSSSLCVSYVGFFFLSV